MRGPGWRSRWPPNTHPGGFERNRDRILHFVTRGNRSLACRFVPNWNCGCQWDDNSRSLAASEMHSACPTMMIWCSWDSAVGRCGSGTQAPWYVVVSICASFRLLDVPFLEPATRDDFVLSDTSNVREVPDGDTGSGLVTESIARLTNDEIDAMSQEVLFDLLRMSRSVVELQETVLRVQERCRCTTGPTYSLNIC